MGITAIASVAGSLISKLESLHSSKAAKVSTPAQLNPTQDGSSVSGPGMFFSQLQNLSQQNPAEFKKITAQVAQQLQTAGATSASAASAASPQTTVLNQMASNFHHASQTGSFSDLFSHAPQTTAQQASTAAASGHPHHRYAESSGASDATTVSSIFSQALSQIKSDFGGAAALKSSSL